MVRGEGLQARIFSISLNLLVSKDGLWVIFGLFLSHPDAFWETRAGVGATQKVEFTKEFIKGPVEFTKEFVKEDIGTEKSS